MDKKDIIQYLNNSESLGNHSLNEYISVIREYPYFQSAHILFLKALKDIDSPNFQHQLEETSIFISNRKKLYDYLSEEHRHTDPYTYELKEEEKEPGQKNESPSLRGKEIVTHGEGQANKVNENKQDDEEEDKKEDEEAGEKQNHTLNEPTEIRREGENTPGNDKEEEKKQEYNVRRDTDSLQESIEQALLSQIEDANTDWDNIEFKGTAVVDIIHPGEDDPELSFKAIQESSKKKEEAAEPEIENHETVQPAGEGKDEKIEEHPVDDGGNDDEQVMELEPDQPRLIPEYFKPYLKESPGNAVGISPDKEVPLDEVAGQQKDLIENFISTNPRIQTPAEPPEEIEDISKESVTPREAHLTETLANIYIRQGYYSKAIFAYEKLSLKYPEKSIYFAEQIKKVKELINK